MLNMWDLAAQVDWIHDTNSCYKAWLRCSEAWTEGGTWKPLQKRTRSKAHQWLIAVENILQQYTGKGLVQYLPVGSKPEDTNLVGPAGSKPGEEDDPYSWPWLGIALDRGPDSWAAKQFLKYALEANVEEFPDQSHDCWNDARNALRETGLWNHVLVMILALNLAHAPYDGGKWFNMATAAFFEYYHIANHMDPLFQRMLPKILSDWDEMHRMTEPGISQDVWNRLPLQWCWKRRGVKVGMCRFFGFMTASVPYRRIFHTKLLGMIYLGMKQGWLKKASVKTAAKRVLKVKDTGADKKQSTKDSKQQVSKLFGYGNAMQLVTICCLEANTYFHQCMIEVCSAPLVAWHQHQNKTLRSCEGAGPWFREQACGGFLRPCCAMFAVIWSCGGDGPTVQSMGFYAGGAVANVFFGSQPVGLALGTTPGEAAPGSKPEGLNHPEVMSEYERAMVAFMYTLNLVSNRVRRCFWAMRGWPAQSCLFGAYDSATRLSTIATLKQDLEGYLKCKAEAPEFFGQKNLSVFETRPVKQAVRIMKVTRQNNGE